MILIKMNLKCNLSCDYCYQTPIRPSEEIIDFDAVENRIRELWQKEKSSIVLHGGEPLLLDLDIIERFLKLSYDLSGKSSVQTNGTLINDRHIELFKKYKTSIGLSIDGPFPCNELRGFGSQENRRKITEKVIENLNKLIDAELHPAIIAVIHKSNGLRNRRDIMKEWVKDLYSKKVTGRLNQCYSGNPNIDLSVPEALDFYTDMLEFMVENEIRGWSPFRDILNSLKGSDNVVCIFKGCDPFCTPSATSIFNDGSVGVCLRLYMNEGKKYLRLESKSDIRLIALQNGDCNGCKWWNYCKGGCPGMAIDSDWRRKDRLCEVYQALFKRIDKMIKFTEAMEPETKKKCSETRSEIQGFEHYDGIEHLDGNLRHLDSDMR